MWSYCISNQFPISSVEKSDGKNVILMTGHPHQGYTIQTQMRDGKLNGVATIKSPDNNTVAKYHYKDNEISGECVLFYDSGELFFDGSLENGYREGFGIEYDKNGSELFIGSFENGNRKNRWEKMDEDERYWKEIDRNDNVVAIYKMSERNRKERDLESNISRKVNQGKVSVKNSEISLICHFENGNMTEYKYHIKCFEGAYDFSTEKGFIRKNGKEYDETGKNVIYCGEYLDGKWHGYGISYKNGEIEYEGEWVNGFPKPKFIKVHIVVPIIILVCIAFLVLVFPLYTILKWIIITILLLYGLRIYIYGEKSLDYVETIIRSVEPKLKRNMFKYHDGCMSILDSVNPEAEYFKVNGLRKMKNLKIGNNSFTPLKKVNWDSHKAKNQSRSFYILNCESLASIEIGEFSFSGFAGKFELYNLKSLKSIQIGTIGSKSNNFCWSSFVIRGTYMISAIECVDLPNLESIILGDYAFCRSLSTRIESIECK